MTWRSTGQGAALEVFRAMQSSAAVATPRGVDGGDMEGGGGGVAEVEASTAVSSEFLSTDVWCKTITTVAQVRAFSEVFRGCLAAASALADRPHGLRKETTWRSPFRSQQNNVTSICVSMRRRAERGLRTNLSLVCKTLRRFGRV